MATLKSVVEKWDLLPSKTRNGKLAKAMAKTVVLKLAGVFGKNFLKSMGEAKFLKSMYECVKDKQINSIKYEDEIWEYQPKMKHYHPDFKIKVGHSLSVIR